MRPPHGQQHDTPLNPTNSQLTFSPPPPHLYHHVLLLFLLQVSRFSPRISNRDTCRIQFSFSIDLLSPFLPRILRSFHRVNDSPKTPHDRSSISSFSSDSIDTALVRGSLITKTIRQLEIISILIYLGGMRTREIYMRGF